MREEYEALASCFSWCKNISLAEDKNAGYLVLQLPQGEFLSKQLVATKAMGDLATVLPLLTSLNSALNNLQHCGIQHGRVAPDSIFIMSNGAVGLVDSLYVAAKQRLLAEDHEGATTIPNRDALYASPDVCFGREVSEQDNVFSLACLCYHFLSGQHPFAGNNSVSALLNKTRPTPITTLSDAQWQHLEYGLSFAQESRPKTVSAFINGFDTVSKSSNNIKKKNKETAAARKKARNIINQKKSPKTVKKAAIVNKKPTEQKFPAGVTSSREMTLPTWSWIPLSLLAGISVGVIATILSIHLLDVNPLSFVMALVGVG
jgi:serine/threonine protein kinase